MVCLGNMEEYRGIEGYEGLYAVSNYGNVKSLARDVEWKGTIRHQPECILKPTDDGHGYLFVNLYKDSKRKTPKVHRLVASAFIENPDNLPQVNHKDEVKTHNTVENLEWSTAKDNSNYGTRNTRIAEAMRGVYNTKLSIPVDMLTKDGEFIRQFPSCMEAERWLRENGYPKAAHTNIIQCCKGNPNYAHAYGFKWRYAQGN